jgi:hypothetical protein
LLIFETLFAPSLQIRDQSMKVVWMLDMLARWRHNWTKNCPWNGLTLYIWCEFTKDNNMYGLWILYMQCGEHCPFSNHLHNSNEDGRRCLVGRRIVQILTYFIQLLLLYIQWLTTIWMDRSSLHKSNKRIIFHGFDKRLVTIGYSNSFPGSLI